MDDSKISEEVEADMQKEKGLLNNKGCLREE